MPPVVKKRRIFTVVIYGGMTAVSRASTTILAFFYAGVMSPQDLGAYAVALSLAECFGILADGGMSSAVLRNYFDRARDEAAAKQYLSRLILASRSIAIGALLLTMVIVWFIWGAITNHEIARWPILPLVFAVAFFDRIGRTADSVSRALDRPGDFALFRGIQAGGVLVLGVVLVAGFKWGVSGGLLAMVGSLAIAALIRVITLARLLPAADRLPERSEMVELLKFGLPFVPRELGVWGRQSALRLVLAHLISLADIGSIFLAYSVGSAMMFVTNSIDLAFSPYYYKKRAEGDPTFRQRVVPLTSVVFAGVAPAYVAAILFIEPLGALLLPKAHNHKLFLVPIVLVGTFCQVQQPFAFKQLLFHRKSDWIAWIALAPVLVGLALVPFVLHAFGLTAVVWTMSASNAAVVALAMAATRRVESVDFPVKSAVVLMAMVTICAIAVTYWGDSLSLISRAAILAAVGAVCALGWIWPKRDFIRQILSR
jgi:O-antigen/teichoic acid export membrane protein